MKPTSLRVCISNYRRSSFAPVTAQPCKANSVSARGFAELKLMFMV
jgi:hypothetical protein